MSTPTTMLSGATCYLSGPMDFVLDRAEEARTGWRSRVTDVLESWGVEVFDPWFKPIVANLPRDYGLEDETTTDARENWTFVDSPSGAEARARVSGGFWPVMHTDLRMVDKSDFIIACCSTNLYSVGTPHEIVLARQQRKPVLLVSPAVRYLKWKELLDRAKDDNELESLVNAAGREVVVRENGSGTPSLWYATLVGSEGFFDGFGWPASRPAFDWEPNYLDEREAGPYAPKRPLLRYLQQIHEGHHRPQRWDNRSKRYRDNDDWLLLRAQATESED